MSEKKDESLVEDNKEEKERFELSRILRFALVSSFILLILSFLIIFK